MTTKPLGEAELKALADALRRMRGTEAYPPTAEELFKEAGVEGTPPQLAMRGAKKHFLTSAKEPSAKHQRPRAHYANALVFLREDTDSARVFARVLTWALKLARDDNNNLHTRSVLTSLVPIHMEAPFRTSLVDCVEGTALPPAGVGLLRKEGDAQWFLLSDVLSSGPVKAVVEQPAKGNGATPLPPFPEAFGQAFEELDRESGKHNYVLLHDLRRRLSQIPRPDFDRGLNELRRSKAYSLDSADGRHVRLTPEQQEAGIREAGSLLVYVARR